MLEPLYRGENALEPERVTEKLHQNTFWMGRGGTLTHTISGIDIALWDILGKATGQPVGRLLGGSYRERVQPYCSLLMEEPAPHAATSSREYRAEGLPRLQDRLGPVRPARRREARRGDRARRARGGRRRSAQLIVDAGASDAYWPHGLKWAMRTAEMLKDYDVGWFEEALKPDALDDFCHLRRVEPGADRRRRGADPPPELSCPGSTRGAFDIVQPDVDQGRRHQRAAAHRLDGRRISASAMSATAGTRRSASPPTCSSPPRFPMSISSSSSAAAPMSTASLASRSALDAEGYLAIPTRPGLGVDLDPDKLARYTPDPSPLFRS